MNDANGYESLVPVPVPVWLDCDPGHDDAFAILLAAYHPGIKLLGISTVFGNASLDHTTRNAASILTAIGKHKDIPLYRGSPKALKRPAVHAPDVHGESGLDGTNLLPKPQCEPLAKPAVEAMYEAIMAQPGDTAWIVATGSLTNVGTLLQKYPDVTAHIRGISLMGGSLGDGFSDAVMGMVNNKERIGNISPWAEFNILIDPEAAAAIFHDEQVSRKTTVVPLDLSHQVLATDHVRGLLLYGQDAEQNGPGRTMLRRMLVELLYFFAKTYADVFGITAGPPLHDPIAVAAVLIGTSDAIPFYEWDSNKSVLPQHKERFQVTVVTEGTFEQAKDGQTQTGRTIARLLPPGEEGVRIPRALNVARFWEVIEECISRADERNKALGNEDW